MSKRVVIEQQDNGNFSIVGTVSNMESLGMIEYAKVVLLDKMKNPEPAKQVEETEKKEEE